MKQFIILPILWALSLQSGLAQGIKFFEGTLEEAKALAAKEHKIIFMDAYTSWCGPCKSMARNVFTQQEVGQFYNKYFINIKIDMEKGEGPKIAQKYRVTSYPTFLFLDEKGEIVHLAKGSRPVDKFIGIGSAALNKNDKSADYAAKYETGKREPEFLRAYARELQKNAKSSLKIVNEYIRSQKDMTTKENIAFIWEFANESDSKIFDLLIQNKAILIAQNSEKEYNQKALDACNATVKKAVKYKVESLVSDAQKQMKAANPKFAKEYKLLSAINYQKGMGDFKKLDKKIEQYLKKYAKKDAAKWHEQAKYFLAEATTKNELAKAEDWVKKAIELDPKKEYTKTYAAILQKAGRPAEAQQLMENAKKLHQKLN